MRKKPFHTIYQVKCLLIFSRVPCQRIWMQVLPHLYSLVHYSKRQKPSDEEAVPDTTAANVRYLPDKRRAKQQLFGLHHRANGPPLPDSTTVLKQNLMYNLIFSNMTFSTNLINWFSTSPMAVGNTHFTNLKTENENEK